MTVTFLVSLDQTEDMQAGLCLNCSQILENRLSCLDAHIAQDK